MTSLEDILLDAGVSSSDLAKAKSYQQKRGGGLERILVSMGSLAESSLADIYCALLSADRFDELSVDGWQPPSEDLGLDHKYLHERGWLLWDGSPGVTFVTKSPLDFPVLNYLSAHKISFDRRVCNANEFSRLLSLVQENAEEDLESQRLSSSEEDRLREQATEAPTVNLLNALIAQGLKLKASDMHIEPRDDDYLVRYRVDGVLQTYDRVPPQLQLPLLSRIKILAGMDIAERRRPQDGKIETRVSNVDLDVRVSALPLSFGESMVLRFLVKTSISYSFSTLGMALDTETILKEDIKRTAGVVLLTGPTGSGKTTTLYTFLNELNRPGVKIITLEDPVEYKLPGLSQVQVNSDIGYGFSAGLRSILRQDPDIIMVGEIRDAETCRIAMQAALTGHLVFSTVHTNDAPSAFTRLVDLGAEEFMLNASVISVVAQRLVRKLCSHCSSPHETPEAVIERHGLASKFGMASDQVNLRAAVGCAKCSGTGYAGRFAVNEYLPNDDEIKTLKKDELFTQRAREYNAKLGHRTLFEDGYLRALQGLTTIDEVMRVCA
jgi:general secretion pathway protein E